MLNNAPTKNLSIIVDQIVDTNFVNNIAVNVIFGKLKLNDIKNKNFSFIFFGFLSDLSFIFFRTLYIDITLNWFQILLNSMIIWFCGHKSK